MKFISLILMVYVPALINLKQLLKNTQPDVIGLQEIKVADEDFPYAITENLGYHVFHHGQKGITVSHC